MVSNPIFLYSLVVVGSFTPTLQFQILRSSNNSNYNPRSTPSISRGHDSNVSHLYSEKRWNTNGKTNFGRRTDEDVSRFLTDFRTADGTVVNPYKILQVSRSATIIEIKQSYRRLSRKLHPDMVAQMEILPGRCTNLGDVRDEWEQVKLSYEILTDTQMRKSYDRNSSVAEVLSDPGAAVGRAVIGGAMSGLGLVLGGAWKLGEMAAKTMYETAVVVTDEGKGEEASTRSKQYSDLGVINDDLSILYDGNGGRVEVDTDEASVDDYGIETSTTPFKSIHDSSTISATASYLSQINPPKSSFAVEMASDSDIPTKEEIEGGKGNNAMNILTVKTVNAKASDTANKMRTPRKGTRGFGK